MERVRMVDMEGVNVKFASAEDLVIHKVFVGKARNMEDVKAVLIENTGNGFFIHPALAG